MKTILLLAATLAVAIPATARTWTSADGSKTFEGELRAFDADTGVVSVIVAGRLMEFTTDKLSSEDIAFLKESASAPEMAGAAGPNAETEIGKKITKAKLHRLEGDRFKKTEPMKDPKYYVLYYSASW